MEMRATIAILLASPGSMTGAGGFWITSKGLIHIPPHTPKVRETLERAVAQCLAMRDPDFLPGPTPKPHKELKTLGEKTVAALATAIATSSIAEPSGGIIIFQNLLTGTYIYVDTEGHVHFEVVDPRVTGFIAAAQAWLAAEKFDNQAIAHSVQEPLVPYIQDRAVQLTAATAHA